MMTRAKHLLIGFAFFCMLSPALAEESAHVSESEILVFAASSLSAVLPKIAEEFEDQNNVRVNLSFASSATLAHQIRSGAPADLFISANQLWIDAIQDQLTDPRPFISNTIVLTTFASNKDVMSSLSDLPALDPTMKIAMGDPSHSPLGQYTRAALDELGLWETLAHRMIFGANARAAAQFIEQRAVDYAFLYSSDIANNTALALISPVPSAEPIQYFIASTHQGQQKSADLFRQFLFSESAKKLLIDAGFEPLIE